ncbi:unnamed protein product [Rotaria sordida]|uniref:Major facilitator superfamily (MFS) profile domain-containing protein n=1 Tax=Rotaria sordida TaxID=392033 RepID=A0A814Z7B9_9BILA|nr:unnamed protein product [Rotaria sordida]CAF1522613.1 unnamed protein product [Rotaria sordida]
MTLVSDQEQENTDIASSPTSMPEKEVCKDAEEKKVLSIYDIHTKFKKNLLLVILGLLGSLSVFDEAVYAPALPSLIRDLITTKTLALMSISVYLFGISLSSLIWGMLLDYYGRKWITTFGFVAFILTLVGCYFSSNIYMFIIFRALQGCLISVILAAGQGTIADIYHPDERGTAYGIFFAFYFAAVFPASIIGGKLAENYGWRSVFISVIIISVVMFISYVLVVPETHQYQVICMYQNQKNITLLESEQVSPPKLINPYVPLLYLGDRTVVPYVFVLVSGFVIVNCGVVLFPPDVSKPPYSYREGTIGMLLLPYSIAILLGSVIGGRLSDLVTKKSFQLSTILEVRIVPGLILCILVSIGSIIYGWTIQFHVHVSVLILGQVLYGFGQGASRPGVLSYYTIQYQEHAASINSANNLLQQLTTSIVIALAGKIILVIDNGWFFTVLAICNLLAVIVAAIVIHRKFRLSTNPEKKTLL